MRGRALTPLLVLVTLSWAPPPAAAQTAPPKVIYGADDRVEYFQASANERLAADSTVSLFFDGQVVSFDGGATYVLSPDDPVGPVEDWCLNEPFYSQPAPAFCSGVMVGPDLIATAGHCVSAVDCGNVTAVFGFRMANGATAALNPPAADVYRCTSVVDGELGGADDSDWRVFRVDRPIVGRKAVPIRTSAMTALPNGTTLTMIGHPVGLPVKIAGGAFVRDNTPFAFFVSNTDSYGGNSGSAVFNAPSVAAGAPFVEGILVRGEQDFVFQDTCFKSKVCTDLGCSGEDVTRAKEIEEAIPNPGAMILSALFDFGGASAALDLGAAPGTDVGDAVIGLRDAAGL